MKIKIFKLPPWTNILRHHFITASYIWTTALISISFLVHRQCQSSAIAVVLMAQTGLFSMRSHGLIFFWLTTIVRLRLITTPLIYRTFWVHFWENNSAAFNFNWRQTLFVIITMMPLKFMNMRAVFEPKIVKPIVIFEKLVKISLPRKLGILWKIRQNQ